MIIRSFVKGGLAAGAVYYTKTLGVWGSSTQTEHLYNNIVALTKPYALQAKQKLPFEVPLLPQTGEIRYLAKHYYNKGVKGTINFFYMLPCYTGQAFKKVKDTFNTTLASTTK